MNTLTSIFLQADHTAIVAEKARHIAEVDPHGFIICLVSISCVFGVLFLLYAAYGICGKIFIRKAAKAKVQLMQEQTSYDLIEEETAVAMAAALFQYELEVSGKEGGVHDNESGVITIKR